jgi:hypothetical protein
MIKKAMILITKKTIITIKMEKTTIMSRTKKVHMTMINNNYRGHKQNDMIRNIKGDNHELGT